jgi:hypothetical protein
MPIALQVCLKTFADRKSIEQHESYHKRVHLLIEQGDLEVRSLIDFASSFPVPFSLTCFVCSLANFFTILLAGD